MNDDEILDAVIDAVLAPPKEHEPISGCREHGCRSPEACVITCYTCLTHPPYCHCK